MLAGRLGQQTILACTVFMFSTHAPQEVCVCGGEAPLDSLLAGASALMASISSPGVPTASSTSLPHVTALSSAAAAGGGGSSTTASASAVLQGASEPTQPQQRAAAVAQPALATLSLTSPAATPAGQPVDPGAAAAAQPRAAPRLFPRTAASAGPRFVGRIAVQSLAGEQIARKSPLDEASTLLRHSGGLWFHVADVAQLLC